MRWGVGGGGGAGSGGLCVRRADQASMAAEGEGVVRGRAPTMAIMACAGEPTLPTSASLHPGSPLDPPVKPAPETFWSARHQGGGSASARVRRAATRRGARPRFSHASPLHPHAPTGVLTGEQAGHGLGGAHKDGERVGHVSGAVFDVHHAVFVGHAAHPDRQVGGAADVVGDAGRTGGDLRAGPGVSERLRRPRRRLRWRPGRRQLGGHAAARSQPSHRRAG